MNGKVRVRIAPSPTGMIQAGNMRTALFNYLFSKKEGGSFVLRVEDTDKQRSREDYYEEILRSFAWLGIPYDEGPDRGGPYAPYRQSQRTELYKTYLKRLLDQENAYYCFCTPEELDAQRQHQMSLGEAPRYSGACRTLSQKEREKRIAAGERGVIRFLAPHKTIAFRDLIRGEITFDTSLLGDMVVAKDLETPLYNFTVVIDDFEMQITHVIRGEDHIANTQKQILLQEALDLPGVQYAHLPLLLGPDRTKLSKRHGDTSIKTMREQGYLPEAVVNFLALLGWSSGDDREIFSIEELVREFSLERIQKGGAVFNIQRLDWINGHYIRKKPLTELTKLCREYVSVSERMVALYQERLKKVSEIEELTDFFFADPEYDRELLRWKHANDAQTKEQLQKAYDALDRVGETVWNKKHIEQIIIPEAEKASPPAGGRGYMLWPLRVALTGKKASAGPFEIAEVLGKQVTLFRIQRAIDKL